MKNFRINKPRPAGSVYDAIADAFGEIEGGVTKAAEILDKSRPYVNAMSDADATGKNKANISLQQAGQLSEAGATALAEWLAIKAGGVFVPTSDNLPAEALHDAIAAYSKESGEAISAALRAGLDHTLLEAALKEVDEAIGKLTTFRSLLDRSSNVVKLRMEPSA